MKVDVIVDEKKKSRILSTYEKRTSLMAMATASLGHFNLSAFHCL